MPAFPSPAARRRPRAFACVTSAKPGAATDRTSSAADGRYAVDAGRYAYARRSETRPPTNGTTRRNQTPCTAASGATRRLGDVEQRDPSARPQHPRALGEERFEVRRSCGARTRETIPSTPASGNGSRSASPRTSGASVRARSRACRPRSRRRSAGTRPLAARGTGRRCRTRGRARRDPGGSRSAATARAPPPDVHAKRQHAVQQVVARRDAVEHLLDGARLLVGGGERPGVGRHDRISVRGGGSPRAIPPRARCRRRPTRGAPARPRAARAGSGARRAS